MAYLPSKSIATHAGYIDPVDCNSVIGYAINSRRNVRASMKLTDCNHSIDWQFDEYTGVSKIDRVIAIMEKFRTEFIAAQKNHKPVRRKRA